MTVKSSKPPANGLVAIMRRVYNPIGFSKGYNFVLFVILFGAMMGFSLARFMYLDYDGIFCKPDEEGAAPGECWSYRTETYRLIGIKLHLYTVMPGAFLACLQFIPIIRHKVILFHRMNGYVVLVLNLAATVGTFMIIRVSFGGGLDVQTALGLLSVCFIGAMAIAIYNVKKLQLEQHRAWMLRAWAYGGVVITSRLIMVIAATIIGTTGEYYFAIKCDKMASFYDAFEDLQEVYPACTSENAYVAVKGSLDGPGAENGGSAVYQTFGVGLWLGFAIHSLLIELYLNLTPAESERLRNISYQRQVEAGFKHPGRSGWTADRLGDAEEWVPAAQRNVSSQTLDEITVKPDSQSSSSQ